MNQSYSKKMIRDGYVYLGKSNLTGGWALYNEKTKVCAMYGLLKTQNITYGNLVLRYDPKKEYANSIVTAVKNIVELPEVKIENRGNGRVMIKADAKYIGKIMEIYDLNGHLIQKQKISVNGNLIQNMHTSILIVKIEDQLPVKFML